MSQDVRYDFSVSGMTCAACAARLEKVLNRLPGVEASVNFAAETARVSDTSGVIEPAAIVAAVAKAGFSSAPLGLGRACMK